VQRYDWAQIRAEYEIGASQSDLARRHGCSRKAVQNRIAAEGWTQDVRPALDRLTAERVAGVVAGCDPVKKAHALAAEADRRCAVVERHKAEWDEHQTLINRAIQARDFDLAKLAKITAETILIRQGGERKAWGLDSSPVQQEPPRRFEVIFPDAPPQQPAQPLATFTPSRGSR